MSKRFQEKIKTIETRIRTFMYSALIWFIFISFIYIVYSVLK